MRYNPNFDCISGAVTGYDPRDNSPSPRNLQVMQRALFENFFNGLDPVEDWDSVILSLESYLGFWKQMYCGLYEVTPWEQELASDVIARSSKRRRSARRTNKAAPKKKPAAE